MTTGTAWSAVWVVGADPVPGAQVPYPVNPGDLDAKVGTPVSQQTEVTNPGGHTLTYTASGLPPGLTIDSATGLISGEYRVVLGVTDTLHARGSTWFMWYVA